MDGFRESSERIVKREVSTKKNHLLSLFKNLEVTILDKKKKYFDKLQCVVSAWEQIGNFVAEKSSESPQPEFDSLFLHTLRLVLRADWRNVSKATKTHLLTTLTRIKSDLKNGRRFFSILPQCCVLESVINDPWEHETLNKIFQKDEIIVDIDELIKYFHFENGKVIVIRLEILLESKCEAFASRLAKACLMTYNLTDPLELELNQDELDYITDIYFCCLIRAKETKSIVDELKTFDINQALRLLQRYDKVEGVGSKYNENCREARVWKHSKRALESISSTLIANAVIQDNFDSSDVDILHDLIREWASIHTSNSSDIFSSDPLEMIWKCVLIARCSMCIYPFCSFLMERGGKQHCLNQLVRCLIRAINQNMNEIEQHRACRNDEKLKFTHDLLAKGYLLTAELFREYRNIFRECLLTAFSLTPTRESLQRLEDFVNNDVADVNNAPNPPASEIKIKTESVADNAEDQNVVNDGSETADTPSSSAAVVSEDVPEDQKPTIIQPTSVDGKNGDQIENKAELNTSSGSANESIKGTASAYISEVESMKIEDSIKTDLNSILQYQRYRTLTWDLEWPVLKANCEKYHEMFEKRGFAEVELKFLDLDYDQFKNRPIEIDESAGIEKGYEHFINNDIEESELEYSYSRRAGYSTDDSYYDDDEDDDYGRKKRKKLRTRYDEDHEWGRKTTQRKLPKAKVKIESFDTADENSADSLPNGEVPIVKILTNKRRPRGRPRNKSFDAETNADSQSENQPPDEEDPSEMLVDGVIGDCSVKTAATNLQLLRQFRISLSRPLSSDENTTNIARQHDLSRVSTRISLGKSADRVFVDGELLRLEVYVPKCDGYPFFNNVQKLVQKLDAFHEKPNFNEEKCSKLDKSSKVEKLALHEEVVSPKSPSIHEETPEVVDCPDTVSNEPNSSSRGRGRFAKPRFKYHAKQSSSSKRFWYNRDFRKKLFGVSVMKNSKQVKPSKQNVDGIDDVIGEMFPEFSSNGSWQTNGNFDDHFFEPPPPPPVAQQPTQTLSEFLDTTLDSTLGPTSSNEATFVSSTVDLTSLPPPIVPVADGSSPPSCNELTPLQPASSPPLAVLSTYLNSSIDSIDTMYSYPSNICHNQQTVPQSLTNEDFTSYELSTSEFLDISSSMAEPAYSGYSGFPPQIPDDVYSMNVSSTYDAVVPSSSCVLAPLPPTLSNEVPTAHSNNGVSFTPVTAVLKPNSKLREALQKDCTVSLQDIALTRKQPLQEDSNDSVTVNQILDEYRDTMDKHPELGHVLARRKRVQDSANGENPSKRPRRSKKDVLVVPSNEDNSLSSPNLVQVPSAVVLSPMNHVQVPLQPQQQTPPSNGQVMQCNQMNNVYGSLPSEAVLELPSCATAGISSQTYGDVGGCEIEVISNVSTYDDDSGHVMNANGCSDEVASVPSQGSNTYWSGDTSLMTLDGANVPANADDSCGDLKTQFSVATYVYNGNSTESTDSAVIISIPENQYLEEILSNSFPLGEGTSLLLSGDGLYSKNQNADAAADAPNTEFGGSGAVPKPDNATFENGVILNIDNNMLYDSNYSAEMNNYET